MVAQKRLVLLAAIFAAARSQAPVGGELGGAHVARYLRGREDEEAPALHYFATDPEWKSRPRGFCLGAASPTSLDSLSGASHCLTTVASTPKVVERR